MSARDQGSLLRAVREGFIAIGRADDGDPPPGFPNAAAVFRLAVGCPGFWQASGQQCSEEDLRLLIRGMVLFSRLGHEHSLGGSVSPVIGLFHAYAFRFPEREPELASWVVRNRTNPYEPYGSTHCNEAPSLLLHGVQRLARSLAVQRRVAQEQGRAHAVRLSRDAEHATVHLPNAIRRGDVRAVTALLDRGAQPHRALCGGGSLVDWAMRNGRVRVAELLRQRGVA